MSEALNFHFDVDGENFTSAGQASVQVKKILRQLGVPSDTIRRVSIAMYEGEINMVIHAYGGKADVNVYEDRVEIILDDKGPGIENVDLAMQEGYSTATDNIRSLGFGNLSTFRLSQSGQVHGLYDLPEALSHGSDPHPRRTCGHQPGPLHRLRRMHPGLPASGEAG